MKDVILDMKDVVKLVPKDRKELVCPFRTVTINMQLSDGRVISKVEYPPCQYELCPFYKKDNCSRIDNT